MKFWIGTGWGLLLIALILSTLEGGKVRDLLSTGQYLLLIPAALVTVLSQASLATAYVAFNRVFNVSTSTRSLFLLGSVSGALNEFAGAVPLSMHGMRILFLRQDGESISESSAASICCTAVNHLVLLSLGALGLLCVVLAGGTGGRYAIALPVIDALLIAALATAVVLMYSASARSSIAKVLRAAARQTASESAIEQLLLTFDNFSDRLHLQARRHRLAVFVAIVLMHFYWLAGAAAFGFCLSVFGPPVSVGSCVVAFCLGRLLGLSITTPGALGWQELFMIGILLACGAGLEQSAFGVISFRLINQLLPFALALPFYKSFVSPFLSNEETI